MNSTEPIATPLLHHHLIERPDHRYNGNYQFVKGWTAGGAEMCVHLTPAEVSTRCQKEFGDGFLVDDGINLWWAQPAALVKFTRVRFFGLRPALTAWAGVLRDNLMETTPPQILKGKWVISGLFSPRELDFAKRLWMEQGWNVKVTFKEME